MRLSRTTILAGAAALLTAGTAAAAAEKLHTMQVSLPDGSVAQVEYAGDVAPQVTVVPANARTLAAYDPFAGFDRIFAEMQARQHAMMLQMAAFEKAAAQAQAGEPGQFAVAGNLPAGVHYTYVSSTTDANGCTRTVEYRSDGSDGAAQPKITRASAGDCDAAQREAKPIEASAPAPAAQAQPGHEA